MMIIITIFRLIHSITLYLPAYLALASSFSPPLDLA